MIIGITNNEGIIALRALKFNKKLLKQFNENPDYFVPTSFDIKENSKHVEEAAKTFKQFYFDGNDLSSDNLNNFTSFYSDAFIKFPFERTIKMFAESSPHPIYRYFFSYDGALNFVMRSYSLQAFKGVCHGDDLFYEFC